MIGPGILVAATGVGAGDLATATFTGAKLGTAILWAVLFGATLKFMLNEGLTRWQLATGTTILEGSARYLGKASQRFFYLYLVVWSYLVAMALMSACGVAASALIPVFNEPAQGKIVFGILQSLLAVLLVYFGGYKLFEKIMSVCIGLMFVVVVVTAVVLSPAPSDVVAGLMIPRIPELTNGGIGWTVALLGGVGGTVTVLCYGYWIQEEGREGSERLGDCRFDLMVGYGMTAVFGVAMVVIGSQLEGMESSGARLIVEIAEILESRMGDWGGILKWAFMLGAWGAFFSSLLGVWQSVPYLFADFWRIQSSAVSSAAGKPAKAGTVSREERSAAMKTLSTSRLYRYHLLAIALIPISGLFLFDFASAMKINGVVGAFFIPILATALILLNGNASRVGVKMVNGWPSRIGLAVALAVFVVAGVLKIWSAFG